MMMYASRVVQKTILFEFPQNDHAEITEHRWNTFLYVFLCI